MIDGAAFITQYLQQVPSSYEHTQLIPVCSRVRAGLKPFHCTVCEYASRSKSNLKAHMNRHSSERSHLCDLCGKKFKSKVTLKSHRLSHSAEGEWLWEGVMI